MISLWIVFAIILIHFIADFCVQTDEQAKKKSSSWYYLLAHTLSYSTIFVVIGSLYGVGMGNNWLGLQFGGITFICHTLTDYFTSRLNKYLAPERFNIVLKNVITKDDSEKVFWHFPKGESYHNLFVSIGGDQVLHYIQLFLTFYFLTR